MSRLRHFWALPAVLRVAIAAQAPFSVHDDILAFPQYDIVWSEAYIPEVDALSLLAKQSKGYTSFEMDVPTAYDVQTQRSMGDDLPRPSSNNQYERMMFGDVPYLCTIPEVDSPATESATKSEEEHRKELARASNQGWELLQGMQEQCLYYATGWWVYSFCFNGEVRQFHPLPPGRAGVPLFPPKEDTQIGSYTLGKFEEPADGQGSLQKSESLTTATESSVEASTEAPAESLTKELSTPGLQTQGETNFLVQSLEGGTICDLTGRPRRVEVQFHCNPSSKGDRINMIKETASCVYLMVIHTRRLCNDVAFLPPQTDKPNPITCQEIVAEDEVADWKVWKAESMEANLQELQRHAEAAMTMPPPPVVIGGVEVGARKLVGGSPERMIKASNILTNPDNKGKKFIATLASSDGKLVKMMSDVEFEKLGIKAAKETVEEYLNEYKGVRSGLPWKLDLYGTPQGWEFIMIIGHDDVDLEALGFNAAEEGIPNEEEEDGKAEAGGSEEEYK